MAPDALRLIAFAALAASLSGCGCSGDGDVRGDGGEGSPQEEAAPPRDEWAGRMQDKAYQGRMAEMRTRLNAAMKRAAVAKDELDRAVAAGADAEALAVFSNAVKAANADVKKMYAENQLVVGRQIRVENAQIEQLERGREGNLDNRKLNEKRDGGKDK